MKLKNGFFLVLIVVMFMTSVADANLSTKLTSGETHLIGQVDVHNLPEASGIIPENNNIHSARRVDPQEFAKEKTKANSEGFVPPGQSVKVIATPPIAPLTVNSGLILNGASGLSPNPCGCTPPDANVGVGPNHVFEMVNLAGIIYNKSVALEKPTFALKDFFLLPTSSMSDPQILFDKSSGRWFASILDTTNNSVRFAVSTSSDPTETWILYSTPYSSTFFPDQPFMGLNNDNLVISANDFNGNTFAGAQYWIYNKTDLVNAATPVHFSTNTPDPLFASVHPAQHLSPSSGNFYMVSIYPVGTSSIATLFTVSGVPSETSTPTVAKDNFAISSMSVPPSAIQPRTGFRLDSGDHRVLSAVWESDNLWFSATDACRPNGDRNTRSCARIIQINTSTIVPSKVQDFDFAASGQYFFYPAVSLSQGKLVVVYGSSSSKVYPSLLVTGRVPTDNLNTLKAPLTIKSGTAPDLSGRYGDYFGAATDPTSGSPYFWVAGEYSTFQSWNTAIARVTVD